MLNLYITGLVGTGIYLIFYSLIFFNIFFFLPFAINFYYGFFRFGTWDSFYTSSGFCGFVIGLYKGWSRSSLSFMSSFSMIMNKKILNARNKFKDLSIIFTDDFMPPKPHKFTAKALESGLNLDIFMAQALNNILSYYDIIILMVSNY